MHIDLKKPSNYAIAAVALSFIFLAGYGAGTIAARLLQTLGV
tara:strand:+ start:248 stop:373 length:126 start_codon:yes stop_codon:yes gene_type:complete